MTRQTSLPTKVLRYLYLPFDENESNVQQNEDEQEVDERPDTGQVFFVYAHARDHVRKVCCQYNEDGADYDKEQCGKIIAAYEDLIEGEDAQQDLDDDGSRVSPSSSILPCTY